MGEGRAGGSRVQVRSRVLSIGLFLWLAFTSAQSDRACYSGLCVIPTTDTVPAKYVSFEFQVDGTIKRVTSDTYILNTQFGLTDRLEVGVDFDFSEEAEHRAFFNFKWVLVRGRNEKWALAAGFQNIDSRIRKQGPYLVAMREFGPVRGHLGAMRVSGASHMIVGLDGAITDRLTLMADHTAGRDNFSSAGLDWRIAEHLEILAGVLFPNSGSEGTRYTFHIIVSGPLRRRG